MKARKTEKRPYRVEVVTVENGVIGGQIARCYATNAAAAVRQIKRALKEYCGVRSNVTCTAYPIPRG